MVESAIFFASGFLVAALLALLAAPAVSRRATRLANARARLLAPLSETQARAERDALRGEHAIAIARMERRVREVEDKGALGLIELGRRAAEIVGLQDLAAERAAEIARLRAEIGGLLVEARHRDVQLGANAIALFDFERQRDAAEGILTWTQARVVELETLGDEYRAEIAGLETRVAGLEVDLDQSRRAAAQAARSAEAERARLSAALAERMNAVVALEGDLGSARARLAGLMVELDGRTAEASALRERLAVLTPELGRAQAGLESLGIENARQLQRLAEREAALERAEAAHRAATSLMAERAASARQREDALGEELRALATRQAAAEGALRAARGERAGLTHEIETLRARLAEAAAAAQVVARGDQALRQAITRLGREIAREPDAAAEEEPAVGQVVTFTRREPAAAEEAHASEGQTSLSRPRIL